MRSVILVLVLLLFSANVFARDIAGVSLPETIKVNEEVELILNGAGIRNKIFFKIYIAELYLQYPSNMVEKVIGEEGHKQMIMHFLYDEVPKEKIVAGWVEGFQENSEKEKVEKLVARIETFNAMFSDVKKGDIIVLAYTPGVGTEVIIRDESMGVVEGKDFNDALLRIWLGTAPVSSDLKEALLAYEK